MATRSTPDGVVAVGQEGHLQLAPHAVGGRHQHGFPETGGNRDKAGERTDPAEDLRPACALRQRSDAANDLLPRSMSTPVSR